jgi:hypothetical protein
MFSDDAIKTKISFGKYIYILPEQFEELVSASTYQNYFL